ncbi:MAG: hypothetical protein FWE02_02925 [Defluviitaleaceae bacterium]|nr:hypothetical protein [Defluviitaleaceae bacterium]
MSKHIVDTYHSEDKVFKESFSIFKGKSLDFLDNEMTGNIIEVLTNEYTETKTKKQFTDLIFKISESKGRHHEWQHEITLDDLKRFLSYNADLSREYKELDFETIVITNKVPKVTQYINSSVIFKPRIIVLSERNGDEVIARITRQIENGEPINELELIYLPMYSSPSGKSKKDLLGASLKLSHEAIQDTGTRKKTQDLLILLVSKYLSDEELKKVWEDNMTILEDNAAVRVFGEMGREQKAKETAILMLQKGFDRSTISEIIKKPLEWIEEIAINNKI